MRTFTTGPSPLYLNTLNPLSTFMRGASVAVIKYREHGDHPYVTEQWALLDPIFLIHVQSNKRWARVQY